MERFAQTDAINGLQRLFGGESLGELLHIPAEQIGAMYAETCARVEAEDFESALDTATWLVMHKPGEFKFQFALAMCLQQVGQVVDAARHYGLAYMLNVSSAACAYRLGECHEALGDTDAALEAFRTTIELCRLPDAPDGLRSLAEAGIDHLNA